MKVSRTVWSGGKAGDNIKGLPIAIMFCIEISVMRLWIMTNRRHKEDIKMRIHENLKEEDWIDAKQKLPKVSENSVFVYIKYFGYDGEEKITKGMFYINGKKPVFCAYGTEMRNVIAWQPRKTEKNI